MNRAMLLTTLAMLAAPATVAAAPAAYFAQPQQGRFYDPSGLLGDVSNWKDDRCSSTFDLKVANAPAPTHWTVNWRKVLDARLATHSTFEGDKLEALYKTQRGVVVTGADAFKTVALTGQPFDLTSFEFFLKDQAKTDGLVKEIMAMRKTCG